jgi:hypothetical protein
VTKVGVTDVADAAGVVGIRTNAERGTGLGEEQVVLPYSARKRSGLYKAVPAVQTVLAAAHSANVGFLYLFNPNNAQMVALRYVEFTQLPSAVTAMPTLPRVTLERFTATGTPSGGTVTPSRRVRTSQNNEAADASAAATLYTASTGLTVTAGEAEHTFVVRPVVVLYAAGTQAEPAVNTMIYRPDEDEQLVLASGEGVLLRQADAGTTSDSRKIITTWCWEEYTLP